MPFNQLQRRDSWPPTLIRLSNDPSTTSPPTPEQIDEDPISFFLTVPSDSDHDFPSPDYDDLEDLSAGIEGSPESKSLAAIREVSPSSLQRSKIPLPLSDDEEDIFDIDDYNEFAVEDDDEEATFGIGMPLSLKDFSRRHQKILAHSPPLRPTSPSTSPSTSGRESRIGNRSRSSNTTSAALEHTLQGLGISIQQQRQPSATSRARRGRATVRLSPHMPSGTARGRARSLSARRPQSWRVPSPDIYSIEEEREDIVNDVDVDAFKLDVDSRIVAPVEYSSSAPVASSMKQAGGLAEKKKVKKRVHWAF